MRKHLFGLCLAASLCGLAVAQQTAPSTSSQSVIVPRLIRFSGQLKDDAGRALSGTVGITFTLHKTQQDNAALWIETQNVKLDQEGKYSVLLGATKTAGIPTELFTTGEAQWLAIRVEGKPEQPRVLMVSVPYALKAAEAETLAGHVATDFVTSDKLTTVVKEQLQQQTGTSDGGTKKNPGAKPNAASATATNFSDTTSDQVVGVTQLGKGSAINATAISNYAIKASSTSSGALYATGAGNATINAYNTTTTGSTYAILGSNASVSGIGFRGTATATSGNTSGVMGDAASTNGTGVYGNSSSTTAGSTGTGMYGRTAGDTGIAVKATAVNTSGSTTGLLATVLSASGTAAILRNTASGPLLVGQAGASNTQQFSFDGIGNLSLHSGLYAPNSVVEGGWGYFPAPFTNYWALEAISTSNAAGFATAYIKNYDSTNAGSTALEVDGPNFGGQCTIDVSGNLYCSGTLAPVVAGPNGTKTALYTMQTTENLTEDFGRGTLVNGVARVTIDSRFASAINAGDYHVYVTPGGDCKGLYITNRTPTSFEVHELQSGKSAVTFDYRIVAHRKGFETQRMPDVTERLSRHPQVPAQMKSTSAPQHVAELQK